MNELLDFFKNKPQYYNVIRTALTGGVKKAAFFNVDYFNDAIKKYAKKNNKLDVLKAIKKADQIQPKRLPYHKSKKFKGLDNLDLSKDDGKLEFLINIYSDISKHVSKTGKGKEIFQEVLTHFGIDQSNFMRHSGVLIGHPVDPKTGKDYIIIKDGKKIIKNENPIGVEEHAVQMEMARIMMGMAFEGNMKDANKILKAVYSQISLRKNEDPGGTYRESMGEDFYNDVVPRILDGSLDFLPDGYASIYRLMKAGVNPFGYKLINEKQNIAEYFGVNNLSIEEAQQAIIDVFEGKQDIKVLRAQSGIKFSKNIGNHNKLNRAINNARTLKFSKTTQGLSAWDFEDTIARTKSGVRYTLPNPEGTPQPGRKVIFMAGGPGSGKSTVIKGLDLKNQGFKIVNQDISLEWLMKNHGLPTDMKDFTPEQHSKFSSLGFDARMIAKRKQTKFAGEAMVLL